MRVSAFWLATVASVSIGFATAFDPSSRLGLRADTLPSQPSTNLSFTDNPDTTTNATSSHQDPAENYSLDDTVRYYLDRIWPTRFDICAIRFYSLSLTKPPESFAPDQYASNIEIEFYNRTDRKAYLAERSGSVRYKTHIEEDWVEPASTWKWKWQDRRPAVNKALARLEIYQRDELKYTEPPVQIAIARWDNNYPWANTLGGVYYEFYYANLGLFEPKVILNVKGQFFRDPQAFPQNINVTTQISNVTSEAQNKYGIDKVISSYLEHYLEANQFDLCEVRFSSSSSAEPPSSFAPEEYSGMGIEFFNHKDSKPYRADKPFGKWSRWQVSVDDHWQRPPSAWKWSWDERRPDVATALERVTTYQRKTLKYQKPPNKIVVSKWDTHYTWAETSGQIYYGFFYCEFGVWEPKIILNSTGHFFSDPHAFPNGAGGLGDSLRTLGNGTAAPDVFA